MFAGKLVAVVGKKLLVQIVPGHDPVEILSPSKDVEIVINGKGGNRLSDLYNGLRVRLFGVRADGSGSGLIKVEASG